MGLTSHWRTFLYPLTVCSLGLAPYKFIV
jgi:hypothetical protein